MDLFDFVTQSAPAAPQGDALRDEIESIRAQIARHQELYHGLDAPEISDYEYDGLVLRHDAIVAERPDLASADSPTLNVGSTPTGRLPKVAHEIPMLSLSNAFTPEDVARFDADLSKQLGITPGTLRYTAEPKIDGLSCSLIYEQGALVLAATRGDKEIGEDVTRQAMTIADLPKRLKAPFPDRVEVRGEVYMRHVSFAQINERFAAEGRKLLANCRNAAAGALRQSDANETARRPLNFFAYEIAQTSDDPHAEQTDVVADLARWGFRTNPLFAPADGVDQMVEFHATVNDMRPTLGYDIDGIVYKLRSRDHQRRLGTVSNVPRYAIAHKFAAERVHTRLLAIDIQVGRTGKLTPVARLSPVSVGGVVVTNATLHNEDYITGYDIRVGDLVVIQRAGDVIPQIVGLADMPEEDRSTRSAYTFPHKCPECGANAVREIGEADRRCVAGLSCPTQRKERLIHLASKDALDIDGLGEKAIVEFVDAGLISEPADIFRLDARADEIRNREGWGASSVTKLLQAIEARRDSPLNRVIYAFGIRHVGRTATKLLARRYTSLDALLDATSSLRAARAERRRVAGETGDYGSNRTGSFTPERFEDELAKELAARIDIENIGPEIVTSLLDFLDDPNNRRMLSELSALMRVQDVVFETSESAITGQTVVFTGTLETMTRDQAKAHAESLGAKVSGTVSAKTNILVYGPGAGGKLAKAENLGVKLMTEAEWRALIG